MAEVCDAACVSTFTRDTVHSFTCDLPLDARRGKHGGQGAPSVRPVRPDEYQSTSTRMWMEQMAFFSIIITSHNQADFIRNAVASAVAQSHNNREIIVVDDASSDGSQQILEEFGDAIRLTKLDQNVGASRARNVGTAMARGDFLVFLDGDDLLLPWALTVYNEVAEREQPHIILSTMRWFEGEIPNISGDRVPDNIEVVAYDSLLEKDRPYRASASALVISRDAFNAVRGWTNEIFPMEDLDALIKLLSSGRTVQVLAQTIAGGRTCTVRPELNSLINASKSSIGKISFVHPRTALNASRLMTRALALAR